LPTTKSSAVTAKRTVVTPNEKDHLDPLRQLPDARYFRPSLRRQGLADRRHDERLDLDAVLQAVNAEPLS